jgi:hypothetical protein
MPSSILRPILLLAMLQAHGANAQHAPDTEFWDEMDISVGLSAKTTLTIPLVVRTSVSLADPQLYGFGPFFDVALTKHLTATAGYLFVALPRTGVGYKANVPLAAITLRGLVGRLQVSDRNRAEGLIGIPRDPIRYRNKLVLSLPLAQGKWLPFLSDEAFYDFSQAAWSQNRFQVGIGREIQERLRLDVFYLERNVRQSRPTATHAIGTTLELKLTRAAKRRGLPHEEN